MNLEPFVFDVNLVARSRSGLSFTVLEKNSTKLSLEKVTLGAKNVFRKKVESKETEANNIAQPLPSYVQTQRFSGLE